MPNRAVNLDFIGGTLCPAMNKPLSEIEREIIDRTRQARAASGKSQAAVAQVLGVRQDTYKNYELDRCIPPEHVANFCIVTGCDAGWLMGMPGARAPANIKPVRRRAARSKAEPPGRREVG